MEDLFKCVLMILGFAERVEEVVVGGVTDWIEATAGTATGEGFVIVALLTDVEFKGEELEGSEKRDLDFEVTVSVTTVLMELLTFPHSASTTAMISPPPVIESKVRREEMSANKELRLLSPGTSGCSGVDKGGTCSLVLLTLPVVTWGVTVSEGVVAGLSCVDKLSTGSQFFISGLSRERGWDLGVRVRSSLMISTLLARDDMRSGLGGAPSFSSFSLDLNLTLPKRPFSPRRCRPAGWDTVWTWRPPVPLRPPLSNDRKLRDLAEQTEEIELRPWVKA